MRIRNNGPVYGQTVNENCDIGTITVGSESNTADVTLKVGPDFKSEITEFAAGRGMSRSEFLRRSAVIAREHWDTALGMGMEPESFFRCASGLMTSAYRGIRPGAQRKAARDILEEAIRDIKG